MNRAEMTDVVRSALEAASGYDAIAVLKERREATVRFGQNRITQNGDTFRRELELTMGRDGRRATATTHRIASEAFSSLAEGIREQIATAPEDPEYMPPVEAGQVYPVVKDWDEATAGMRTDRRVEAASRAIREAEDRGMEAAGIAHAAMHKTALGTSTGNLAFHRRTRASYGLTVDAGTGSSYRHLTGTAWDSLDVGGAVEEVADEAAAAVDPADAPTETCSVLLEPQAVADLVPFLVYSLNARLADEGVTVFSGMEGQRVTGSGFTLRSELNGPVRGRPFDGEGLPCGDAVWIEDGVLRRMLCGRYWARRTGREPVSSPGCFYVEGGEGDVTEGMRRMDGGLLIRRLWYLRFVDQKSLEITGMTRDGVFRVEDGVPTGPVADFRWNWKPLDLLQRIAWTGRPVARGMFHVPPMMLEGVSTGKL
jgi:predicted Zn-dependent protease